MGHSIQLVLVLVSAASTFFAVPLSGRIHEGLIFSNRDQRTLPKKFLWLVEALGIEEPVYLVADAYYACHTIALGLTAAGSHLISRLRKNSVAFEPIATTGGNLNESGPDSMTASFASLLSLKKSTSDGARPRAPTMARRAS